MNLEQRWQCTWQALRLAPPAAAAADLFARYREPQRHYHTLQHLEECFACLDTAGDVAERRGEVELALWYHDAIYLPARPDNEAQSARLALQVLRGCAADAAMEARVHALILATRHAVQPVGRDAELLVDVDLAILGAPEARYDAFESQIRAEYAAVPDLLFRHGRAKLLREFLARPAIYSTALLHERLEAAARANLQRALAALAAT
ncbi:MAG: N-methyl-D-aspartate receptor NMDAR2C subunit [Rhodocyclaceae bacterium]|nr:N-methyl-D-aspartate receptor NMDAR2C subunit [Rhodocyclaceae bacterium]